MLHYFMSCSSASGGSKTISIKTDYNDCAAIIITSFKKKDKPIHGKVMLPKADSSNIMANSKYSERKALNSNGVFPSSGGESRIVMAAKGTAAFQRKGTHTHSRYRIAWDSDQNGRDAAYTVGKRATVYTRRSACRRTIHDVARGGCRDHRKTRLRVARRSCPGNTCHTDRSRRLARHSQSGELYSAGVCDRLVAADITPQYMLPAMHIRFVCFGESLRYYSG